MVQSRRAVVIGALPGTHFIPLSGGTPSFETSQNHSPCSRSMMCSSMNASYVRPHRGSIAPESSWALRNPTIASACGHNAYRYR